jgi:FkbM family methyltransferase
MSNSTLTYYSALAYVKNIIRALLKGPERIQVPLTRFLTSLSAQGSLTFVQIGSNDGLKNDPIGNLVRQFQWKGIMVEPFEKNFSRLKANFENSPNLIFEQCGITEKQGNLDFYYIENIQPDEPDWYDQVGSFDKTTFIKNIEVVPSLLDRVAVKKIPTKTFGQLLTDHQLNQVDLIHIDTEGYDYKILQTIDFEKYNPNVLIFEIEWMTHYELREIKKLLHKYHYKLYYHHVDCIAVKF